MPFAMPMAFFFVFRYELSSFFFGFVSELDDGRNQLPAKRNIPAVVPLATSDDVRMTEFMDCGGLVAVLLLLLLLAIVPVLRTRSREGWIQVEDDDRICVDQSDSVGRTSYTPVTVVRIPIEEARNPTLIPARNHVPATI